MLSSHMIVAGEKESFIVRTLIKKAQDAGAECKFVPWTVNDIHASFEETELIAVFMEDDTKPKEEVIHFLSDNMEDKGKMLILIGEQDDIDYVRGKIPKEILYKTFTRPVDNAEYMNAVKEYFEKMHAGEFKKSILIVDDDPNYLSLVRQWLKGTYKVNMVNSGLQAIKFLGKNKVDLILLDHEMPVTSGPQVLEMLRSDEETRSIPVMFLTGKSDKNSVMEVVALKPEGYFLKTIEKEELLEKLQEFFILHKK